MKDYHIYVFSQEDCAPCTKLKEHVATLTKPEQAELDFVPIRTPSGDRTALASELAVELTPTLVVVHEDVNCEYSPEDGYEFCDLTESSVERFIGANSIIEHLQATLDAYTYSHAE